MKNIIIPTDFSENVDRAIDFAITNFNAPDTKFWLIHVYRMPYSGAVISTDVDDLLKDQREAFLNIQFEATLERYPNLKIKAQAIQGIFEDVIDKLIKEESIDLVVMGTTGTGGVLFGSMAASIVKNVAAPVVLVPTNYDVAPLSRVLFASDLQHVNGLESLDPLRQIVKSSGAILEILYLEDTDNVPVDEERESLLLDTVFADVPHNFSVRPLIQTEVDILEFATKINADLIVVVARSYGFFERLFHRSVTNKLSMLSDVPLLVLREA